jgi:preprotein translocase subunit YajC
MSFVPFVSDAYAQTAGGPNASPESAFTPLILMVVMLVFFYLILVRPQAKRQKELKAMIEALGKGDEVITSGGLVGRVTELSDQYITLQIAAVGNQPVSVSVLRSAVQTLLPKGTMKSI